MGELLNLVGFSTGVVLYAMLLAMVVRAGRAPGAPRGSIRCCSSPLCSASIWNLCALPAYELPKVGVSGPFPLLIATGFSALGFLPAVVVHSVLRGEHDGVRGGLKRRSRRRRTRSAASRRVLHFAATWTGGAVPSVVRHAPDDVHLRGAGRAAGRRHARPAGRPARAVGGGARDLRGVGAPSQPDPPRRSVVAGRARRPPRLDPARVRDPLPGLSVRARRPLPQARAGAREPRRGRLRRDRPHRRLVGRRSASSSAWTRARSACSSRSGSPPRSSIPCCAAPPPGSSTRSCCGGRTTCRSARPSRAGRRPSTTCRRCSTRCAGG